MQSTSPPDRRNGFTLFLLFLLAALCIVVSVNYYYQRYETQFRTEVEQRIAAVAGLKVAQITQWRRERLGDATILLGNAAFSDLVGRHFEDPGDADARSRLAAWLDKYLTAYQNGYDQALLLDAGGALRLSRPAGSAPPSLSLRELAAEVLRSRTVAIGDFHTDEQDDRIHIALAVPLLEADGETPLGTLVLRADPGAYLYPFLQTWPTPSTTAETLLVRRDGADALILSETLFQKGTALKLRIPLTRTEAPAVEAVLGRKGFFEGVDYRGRPVVSYLLPVPETPWFLATRMDIDEVHGPLRERRWGLLAAAAALLAGTGIILALFWRGQRARYYRERFLAEREHVWLQEVIARSLNEIYIIDLQTLHFKYANASALRNLGYTQEELAALTPLDIKPILSRQEFEGLIRPLLDGERDLLVFETVHRRKDGSDYPVDIHLQKVEMPEGPVLLALANDITERRRAQEALSRSEERFRSLFESMAEGVALHEILEDADGRPADYRILDANAAYQRHTGLEVAQARGKTGREVYGTPSPPFLDEYAAVARTGKPLSFETYFEPLGKHFRVSVIRPNAGQFATVFEDVTERVDRERELRERNEELARFTYTVSHDLKSPLVTVKTFLGYLEQDLRGQDAARIEKDFGYIRGAADKMSRLLDELLDLSRVGRKTNPFVQVPLQTVVAEALDLVAGRIAARGATVEVTDEPVILYGDRPRLVELFQNLLDNAVKFMGGQADPRVQIGVATEDGEVVVSVRDNGIGIDPRFLPKLFGLFEKLDASAEGTGIGLALVKRIVEVHGGKIRAESGGPGQGAAFRFTLARTRRGAAEGASE